MFRYNLFKSYKEALFMVKKIITKYQKEGLLSILNAIYKRLNPIQARIKYINKKNCFFW